MDMNDLRGVCGVSRRDGLSNECVQEIWHENAWMWGKVWCGGMGENEHLVMVWL